MPRHICAVCAKTFDEWIEYYVHCSRPHIEEKKGLIISKRAPMDKETKRAIVAKGETRLGAHNFYGGNS